MPKSSSVVSSCSFMRFYGRLGKNQILVFVSQFKRQLHPKHPKIGVAKFIRTDAL